VSEQPKQSWVQLAKGWAMDLSIALAVALVLKAGVADARKVPTPSMVPTIAVNDRIFVERLVYHFTGPSRGDIIVFTPPVPSPDDYLKRVIGLPGDTIKIEKGKVFVNDVPLEEPYLAEAPRYIFGPLTVPEGKVFVLGDNRNQSYDSHSWGLLDQSAIHGRAWVRYWPLDRFGALD